ncbi:hypothetical protein JY651_46630 [Pyxidicoccus parkwayensis]|uniref:Uncharacterized protein n=1 Tax=Pyxidicoccus parkwayensis TaxID=2813578 RepID=A0ABX7NUF1_9BACT|nr:hypothetical protein [Pyxidicoccus parkwaysis]QSQ22512.1 hypothetical protein JY651_46630 [Pyxidicoccus parkwaysis]
MFRIAAGPSARVRLLLLVVLGLSACTCGSRAIPVSASAPDAPGSGATTGRPPSGDPQRGTPGDGGTMATRPPSGAPRQGTPGDGGATSVRPPSETTTQQGPRPSSFRTCPNKAPGGCDYGEACDFTEYDVLCAGGPCNTPQTGDQRCHRVCDDGACGSGETCVRRTVLVSDTGTRQQPLCLCAGGNCPERGPGGIPQPAEGGLALWRRERDLPMDLYYHAAAASPDRVFVSGGLHIQQLTGSGATLKENAKVFSAPLQPDGSLGEWRESGTLPVPLIHHGMAVLGGRLFVAGGQRDNDFTASVVSAPIREDGSLGPWREEAPLPQPRGWHSLVASDEALWVAGGTIDSGNFTQGRRDVLRAKVSGARVTAWESFDAPTELHYDQGAALANGRLYAVGARGELSSVPLDTGRNWRSEPTPPWNGTVDFGASGQHGVRLVALHDALLVVMPRGLTLTASLQPDGTVKDWRPASRLHHVMSSFATATSRTGRVYVLGGTSSTPAMQRNPEVWSTMELTR